MSLLLLTMMLSLSMSVPIVVDAIGAVVDVDNVPCVLCLLPVGLPLARARSVAAPILSPTRVAAISCNSTISCNPPTGLLVLLVGAFSWCGRLLVHSVGWSLVLSLLVPLVVGAVKVIGAVVDDDDVGDSVRRRSLLLSMLLHFWT